MLVLIRIIVLNVVIIIPITTAIIIILINITMTIHTIVFPVILTIHTIIIIIAVGRGENCGQARGRSLGLSQIRNRTPTIGISLRAVIPENLSVREARAMVLVTMLMQPEPQL